MFIKSASDMQTPFGSGEGERGSGVEIKHDLQ